MFVTSIRVCAFIQSPDHTKVLIVKRVAGRDSVLNTYELPGGEVKEGEDLDVAVRRVVQEVCGIVMNVGKPLFAHAHTINGRYTLVIGFYTSREDEQDVQLNSDVYSEHRWVSKKKLEAYREDAPYEFEPVLSELAFDQLTATIDQGAMDIVRRQVWRNRVLVGALFLMLIAYFALSWQLRMLKWEVQSLQSETRQNE